MPWKIDFTARYPDSSSRTEKQHRSHSQLRRFGLISAAVLGILYVRGAPVLDPFPTTIEFGSQPIQTSGAEHILVVRNVGSTSLNVSHVVIDGDQSQDFRLTTNSCAVNTTGPRQVCQIGVTFIPQSDGERRASLTLLDDARDSPQTVKLIGSGIAREDLSIAPGILHFDGQTVGSVSSPQEITIRNIGSSPLTVVGIAAAGDRNGFAIDSGNCANLTMNSGQDCTLTVRFTPSDAVKHTAHLIIRDSSGDKAHEVILTGSGATGPTAIVRFSPAGLGFGKQEIEKSAVKTITIESIGTAPLRTGNITIRGEGTGEFLMNNKCAQAELSPGSGCTLEIRFVPHAPGNHSAELSIADNAADSPQIITLRGAGFAPSLPPTLVPRLTVHPVQLEFGNQDLRTSSSPLQVTMLSTGSAPVNVQGFRVEGESSKDFVVADASCENRSLSPKAQCALSVIFTPKAKLWSKYPSERRAMLIIADSTGARQPVSLVGTATRTSRPQASIGLSPGELEFGSVQVGTRSASQSVTVTNTSADSIQVSPAILDNAFTGMFTGTNSGHFQVAENTCQSGPLLPRRQCMISVTFTPSDSGDFHAALSVGFGSTFQRESTNLSGRGTGFCCSGQEVSQTTRAECVAKKGRYFNDAPSARNACMPARIAASHPVCNRQP